jgi:MFS family permease
MSPTLASLAGYLDRRGLFYGWILVTASFVIVGLVFGVRLSFGIFFEALTRPDAAGNTAFAWTRGDTAGVFSVTMLVFAVTGTPSGWFLDRFGVRVTFSTGLLIMASGLFLTSRMTSLRQFYLFYGVWTGLGITMLGLTLHSVVISRWFDRQGRRGLAIGLAFAGTGIGILILAPLLERTITAGGWPAAYRLLAGALLFIGLPLAVLLMRDFPIHLGLRPDGADGPRRPQSSSPPTSNSSPTAHPVPTTQWTLGSASRTLTFWLIMVSGMLSLFTLRMVSVHQVAHFVDKGVARLTAATVFGSAGVVTAAAFVVFGNLSDRMGRDVAFYLGAVAQISALVLLILLWEGAPVGLLYAYAGLWGVGEGSRSGLLTALASDKFPGPSLGSIVGTLGAFFGLGAAVGSWLAGFIYDVSGSYLVAFQIALAATVVATLGVFLISRVVKWVG